MTELDFYQQRILNSGVFHGTVLIQAHGEIGGTKKVFVKYSTSAKNGLVYPTIGGVLKNPFKGNAKIFAGDLVEYDPGIEGDTGATVKIMKTYQAAAAATNTDSAHTVQIVRDGFKHIPFVGDFIMVAPKAIDGTGAAVTVTGVTAKTDTTNGDVWELSLSAALTVAKGDVLVEASAGTGTVKAMVTNPNAYAPCDFDFVYNPSAGDSDFEGAKYLFTPCLAGPTTILYKSMMSPTPASVLAMNTSKVPGWFSL